MNERIQELIRLSAVPADQAEDYALDKGLVEPAEKLDVAKFAELIVRECADLCDRFQARDVGMQPAECAGAIRQMFGVKE